MTKTFERQSLYEEVWKTPLSRLGPQYGLSDNGLRKICKTLNIPMPNRGYWAKLAAGHKPPRARLPPHKGETVVHSHPPERVDAAHRPPEESEWLRSKIADEKRPEAQIVVDLEPPEWHPLLKKIRKDLQKAIVQHARDTEARGRWETQRRLTPPRRVDFSFMAWSYLDQGGLLVNAEYSGFIRVSELTCSRALAIANAMLYAADRRGIRVWLDENAKRFAFSVEHEAFRVAIRERQDFDIGKRRFGFSEQRIYHPTNALAIVVERSGATSFEIKDGDEGNVEGRLNSLFVRFYRSVVNAHLRGRLAAVEAQRQAEAAQLRAIRLEAEAFARQASELDKKAREDLHREAGEWEIAQRLRGYIGAVAAAEPSERSDEMNEWIRWAFDLADTIDPALRRVMSSER